MSIFKGSLWGTGAENTGGSLNLETNPTTITTNTTIASVNQIYLVDSSNNNIDITLPISASSGDQIIIHHEAFSSNEVNIIDPAFSTQRFFPNGITRVRCTYMSGTQITSHWDIHGDILGLDGQILPAFKERIVETAVASQFYLSNQALLSGKSLYTNQSILQGGDSQFIGDSGVIEKFFTPSLNITTLKKGVYSISIFANLPNAPTSGTFRLLVDILKIDENGTIGSVVPIAQNIDALNAKTLNNDIERFDFSYITNADIPMNATDRLQLDIKFQGSVSETVKIYYGEGGFTSNIITSIEKKDTLASANLFIGNANNEAEARAITGDISITNVGVSTITSNVVSNSKLAQVSSQIFKGRTTAGTGNVEDLTVAQATTMLSSTTPTASTIPQWDASKNLSANNFVSGITSTATAGGTTTLTVASTGTQVFTGTQTQTLVLPNATTLSNGTQYTIVNQSTGLLTVNMNGGSLLATIPVNGHSAILTLTNIGTTAGTWDVNLKANTTTINQTTISPTKAIPANNDTIDTINNKVLGLINTKASATPVTITNLATGGTIGTASTTVDVNSIFLINQTTTGQTLTLPNPTASTLGQVVSVIANSTAGFTMYGVSISAGNGQQYLWTGITWIPNSTSSSAYTGPNYFTASSQSAMTALSTAVVGDICVRTDTTPLGLFRLTALPASTAGNWKSNITGTLYGQVIYGLAAPVTSVALTTTLNFNSLQHSIGLTNFVSSNSNGLLTLTALSNGLSFEFEGMTVHFASSSNGGIACQWRRNGSAVGTYGGSAVASATDPNIGASALATYSDTISTVNAGVQYDLVLTGWQNLNVYQGNSNIPSSYIKIKAYNL